MQERVARGFDLDAFFPDASGLPEGIPDELLQGFYGGVGGTEYQKVIGRIESRLLTCSAYY
jgi:hypothetical protein